MSPLIILLLAFFLIATIKPYSSYHRPSASPTISNFNIWYITWKLLTIRQLPGMLINYLLNRPQPLTSHALFFKTFFGILGKFAKADGVIAKDELTVVHRYINSKLDLTAAQIKRAENAFREGRDSELDFEYYIITFYNHFKRSPQILRTLLDLLEELAASDSRLSHAEAHLLDIAKNVFGFSRYEYERARFSARFKFTSENSKVNNTEETFNHYSPYTTLGLKNGATIQEIKNAYRKLVKEYHPDSLIARGLSPELRKAAVERFRIIQAAYEELIKK